MNDESYFFKSLMYQYFLLSEEENKEMNGEMWRQVDIL